MRGCYGYDGDVTSIEVVEGDQGVISCKVKGMVSVAIWTKVGNPPELLVILNQNGDPGEKSGDGYEAGLFNITDEFALVINEVKPEHAGQYICQIADYSSASTYESATNVTLQARGRPLCNKNATSVRHNFPFTFPWS